VTEEPGGPLKADWVLMVDIDHFKSVNDTYGHLNGDEVLRGVAQTLKNRVRPRDIVVRWGGEEIFIFLAAAGREGAELAGEKLRREVVDLSVSIEGIDPIGEILTYLFVIITKIYFSTRKKL